ncbi:MAG TPA: hypothetical protein VEY89_14130 [Candidatus Dormibacteraeota bacterium]|nr:hypothetical protein [Candidatus Dormibacteraeota bacterium]
MSVEAQDAAPASAERQVVEAAPAPTAVTRVPAVSQMLPRNPLAGLSHKTVTLAQVQAAATQVVPRLHYQITRLGPTGQAGLAALIAALVFAISTLLPAHHALDSLSADIARAQHPSVAHGPDQAVPRLVESLPTRNQIPGVIGLMYTQAKASNVALDTGHYVYSPPKAGSLARYDIEFPVKAGYPDLRNFINKTLTAVPSAALSKLHVERKGVGDAQVSANIGFVVFVRSE